MKVDVEEKLKQFEQSLLEEEKVLARELKKVRKAKLASRASNLKVRELKQNITSFQLMLEE